MKLKNMLSEFKDEITRLEEAETLLERVYLELGPYNHILSDDLKGEINDHFKFDDSE